MNKHGLRGFLIWLIPLLATAGTCYAVFSVYKRHDFSRQDDSRIAVAIGLGYFFAAATIAILTRRWTLRGLGQLVTYVCDGIFYTTLGGWGEFTRERLTVLRAGFSVGVVALVLGVLWFAVLRHVVAWVWRKIRRRPPPSPPSPDEPRTDQLVSLQIAGTPVPMADA